MPIFIRGDDIEYGLRNMKHLILLNGICVWHEPFENKYSSFLFYYIMRNRLIDNALHNMVMTKKYLKYTLKRQVYDEIRLYRYKNAHLIMRGVEDYFKGYDWLAKQDGEQLHKSVMGDGYKLQFIDDLESPIPFVFDKFSKSLEDIPSTNIFARAINHFTINGHYLSANKGYNVVPTVGTLQVSVFRRVGVLNYDYASRKGFVTMRDKNEFKKCKKRFKNLMKLVDSEYDKVNAQFASKGREMMSRAFWNKYLELE